MGFVDGLSMYFNNILDVTMYIMYFFFAISLALAIMPKKIQRKDILVAALRFVIIYILYVFGESIFFALSNLLGVMYGGILFTLSFAVIPVTYIVIFSKGDALHRLVKIFVIVASCLITSEIGRELGMIVGGNSPQLTFAVVFVRSIPTAFMPGVAFALYKFDINRFKNLPIVHLIITIVLSVMLITSAVWQNVARPEDNEIRGLLVFVSLVELCILVGIYYATYHLIDSRHRITELEVQSTLLSIEKESLLIDEINREELMKIRHDLRNQLSYTKVLLNEGKYQEANQYIESLIDQKEEYLYSFSCSNLVISSIVNLELTKAKIAKKTVRFKVVVPPKLPFEDSDLLSLITNIVDNAIENFVPASKEDVVNVSIVTQQDYLRITSFNTVEKGTAKAKPSLKTTKRNRGHGYGTKIIKNIAKKYDGYVSFEFEEGKFVCDCLINMNHRENRNA